MTGDRYVTNETKKFKDSQEAAYRRIMRQYVRKAGFTKSERDVTLILLDLWFHHRNGPNKCIYPSRTTIARRAAVSVKTVSRTLDLLRGVGALIVMSNTKGGRGRATRYRIDDLSLLSMCGLDIAELVVAMTGGKRDICPGKSASESGTKCPTTLKGVTNVSGVSDFGVRDVVEMASRWAAR